MTTNELQSPSLSRTVFVTLELANEEVDVAETVCDEAAASLSPSREKTDDDI